MAKKISVILVVGIILLALIFWSSPLVFLRLFFKEGSKSSLNSDQNKILNTKNNLNNMVDYKKILMVVAYSNFRDEEYFGPKEIFENNGLIVETISSRAGRAVSTDQKTIEILKTPADIDPDQYLGVVFVGGPGMIKELGNPSFQKLAKDFNSRNKLVAAICIAPALLAKAGILKEKKATVWSSESDQSAIQILRENGAIYEEAPVVQDGNIITSSDPQYAQAFGEAIINYINKVY